MTQDHQDEDAFYRVGRPPATPNKKPKRSKGFVLLIAALAVMVASSAGVVAWLVFNKVPLTEAVKEITESPLETAQKKCAPDSAYATVGDEGKTLILKSQGEEQPGISYSQLECFWTELKITDAVKSEIGATRALDGRRSADWASYHASWSYHPDSGVNMTITMS